MHKSVLFVFASIGFFVWVAQEPVETQEPPLELTFRIGEEQLNVVVGRPFSLKVGEQEVHCEIIAKNERTLRLSDIQLKYPSYYTFEYEPDPLVDSWYLSGVDVTLMIFRYSPDTDPAEMQEALSEDFQLHMDGKPKSTKAELSWSSGKLEGIRLTGQVLESNMSQEGFGFQTENHTYLLVIQDFSDNRLPTAEAVNLRKLLQQDLKMEIVD